MANRPPVSELNAYDHLVRIHEACQSTINAFPKRHHRLIMQLLIRIDQDLAEIIRKMEEERK